MKNPDWIKALLVSVLLAAAGFAADKAPNILLILADDLGYHDLSCQGATDFETPNLDRLAASGVRFTDGYVSAPQCGPSRSGLMTGMSQSRYGCLDNSSLIGLPPADVVQTLPEQLKALGYTTGIIGKWHIGCDNKTEGHPIFPGNHPWERGFDYVLTHAAGHSHYYPYRADGTKWMVDRHLEYRLALKMEDEPTAGFADGLPEDTYLTDYFSEQGSEFITRNQDRPWFLYLAYNAPHTPSVARADKLEKYAHIQDGTRRHLVAMMDSLDEGIGQVLETLEKTGQTRETLVVFLSDNGGPTHQNGSRNDPFSGKKGDVHEGGIRVPFLASWPGTIRAGQELDGPVISLDILPTAVAAGGGSVPDIHEGSNLLPWLKGEAPCPNDIICWSWRSKAAVRIGSLKETRNGSDVTALDGTVVPGHIFSDLAENPQELEAKALQSPEKQKMLSDRLDRWLRQLEQDQKVLTPQATPAAEQIPVHPVETPVGAKIFSEGKGAWSVRGPSDVSFENGKMVLSGSRTGQPIAVYRPLEPVHLLDGQTLKLQATVSTSRNAPRDNDIRMSIGFAEGTIEDSPKLAVSMHGWHFSVPSGGKQAGIRAARVERTGQPENFFNSPEASRKIGDLKLPGSVSSHPQSWEVLLTREGTRLLLSGSLSGVAAAGNLELGSELSEDDFTFNTLGVAYAFSPGETLTAEQVGFSLTP
jgi:arylsulfatase B